MKISSFYLNDTSDSEEFLEKLIQELGESFSGQGLTPSNIGKFIQILRQRFTEHFSEKFNRDVYFQLSLPKNSESLIDKKVYNRQEMIKIYLSYETIKNFMDGYDDIDDYIIMLIEQIESTLTCAEHHFNNYLIIQMDVLIDICYNELTVYSKEFIKNNLFKTTSWEKFAKQSSIFNDYYNFFQEDKEKNKMIFAKFLKKLMGLYEI